MDTIDIAGNIAEFHTAANRGGNQVIFKSRAAQRHEAQGIRDLDLAVDLAARKLKNNKVITPARFYQLFDTFIKFIPMLFDTCFNTFADCFAGIPCHWNVSIDIRQIARHAHILSENDPITLLNNAHFIDPTADGLLRNKVLLPCLSHRSLSIWINAVQFHRNRDRIVFAAVVGRQKLQFENVTGIFDLLTDILAQFIIILDVLKNARGKEHIIIGSILTDHASLILSEGAYISEVFLIFRRAEIIDFSIPRESRNQIVRDLCVFI